jgi:hypothetical protein
VAHQIVAVEGDVEGARRELVSVNLPDDVGESAGQGHSTRADSHERQLLESPVAFDNLVRDPGERPPHPIAVHHYGHSDTFGQIERPDNL